MPEVFEHIEDRFGLVVWHLEESSEHLLNLIDGDAYAKSLTAEISHEGKLRQFLGGRVSVKFLCDRLGIAYRGVKRCSNGKPDLVPGPWKCSITHTSGYCAAIIARETPVGIDLERPRKTLMQVAEKYLSEQERSWAGADLHRYCRLWTAKEAAYKKISRDDVFLKSHFFLEVGSVDTLKLDLKFIAGVHEEQISVRHRKISEAVYLAYTV